MLSLASWLIPAGPLLSYSEGWESGLAQGGAHAARDCRGCAFMVERGKWRRFCARQNSSTVRGKEGSVQDFEMASDRRRGTLERMCSAPALYGTREKKGRNGDRARLMDCSKDL